MLPYWSDHRSSLSRSEPFVPPKRGSGGGVEWHERRNRTLPSVRPSTWYIVDGGRSLSTLTTRNPNLLSRGSVFIPGFFVCAGFGVVGFCVAVGGLYGIARSRNSKIRCTTASTATRNPIRWYS